MGGVVRMSGIKAEGGGEVLRNPVSRAETLHYVDGRTVNCGLVYSFPVRHEAVNGRNAPHLYIFTKDNEPYVQGFRFPKRLNRRYLSTSSARKEMVIARSDSAPDARDGMRVVENGAVANRDGGRLRHRAASFQVVRGLAGRHKLPACPHLTIGDAP